MASCGAPHEVCVCMCVRVCLVALAGCGESGFQEACRRSTPTPPAKRVDFVVFLLPFFSPKCHTAVVGKRGGGSNAAVIVFPEKWRQSEEKRVRAASGG